MVHQKANASTHRSGKVAADPYENFLWNLIETNPQPQQRRDASKTLSGLNRMRG